MGVFLDRRSLAVIALLMSAGLLIYTPWQPAPFDIQDYSELLPILRDSSSPIDSFSKVVRYYWGHGRANVLNSLFVEANWELYGENPMLWRLSRALLMGIVLAATVRFLRRLGHSTTAIATGASLTVVSLSAAGNWLRFTMEPVAFLCFIFALEIAAGYGERENRTRVAIGLLALVLAMLLAKETMIALIPVVAVVALLTRRDFAVTRPRRQAWAMAAALGGLVLIYVGLALWLVGSAGTDAYVGSYGPRSVDLQVLLASMQATLFPMGPQDGGLVVWNGLFAAFVIGGCGLAWLRRSEARGRTRLLICLALYLILSGSLVYQPWGRFEFFYSLPFGLGTILLLAVAADEYLRRVGVHRSLVWAALAIMLVVPGLLSQMLAARTYAMRALNWQLAEAVPSMPRTDSFFVAVQGRAAQSWQGQAATLKRVALLLRQEADLPPGVEKQCEDAPMEPEEDLSFSLLILSYESGCGSLPDPRLTLRREYVYGKVLGLATAKGHVRADFAVRWPKDAREAPADGGPR